MELGQQVSGERVSKSLVISSLSDKTLAGFNLPENENTAGYHIRYNVGSKEHKDMLRALKKERIPRSVIKKAKTSNEFILLDPIHTFSGKGQYETLMGAKTVFHEIGHSFSSVGGYRQSGSANLIGRLSQRVRAAFGTTSLDSALQNFQEAHISRLRLDALEEARAESFAHNILDRIGKNVRTTNSLISAAAKDASSEYDVVGKILSYGSISSWKEYEGRNIDILKGNIGDEFFDSSKISDFVKNLKVSGRTQAHKTFYTAIDSPILTSLPSGTSSIFRENIYNIQAKSSKDIVEYYSTQMASLMDGSLGRKVGASGMVKISSKAMSQKAVELSSERLLPAASAVSSGAVKTSSRIIKRNADGYENSWSCKII